MVGTNKLIGVSCHTIEHARSAVLDGASYLGVGPTFPSQTKTFESFAGLDLVREVAAEIKLPAFAIGGIHLDNVTDVVQSGLNRVAVQHAIINAPDPFVAASDLKTKLRR